MTFQEAEKFVGRKIAENTVVERIDADTIGIRFWATIIVKIHRNGQYTLNSGGYRTVTTKNRINDYAPVNIYQTAGIWYLSHGVQFYDGVVVK